MPDDTIIGLELPLNGDGMPITSYFKFVSIAAVQHYLKNFKTATYLKLLTLTSLSPTKRTYNILIYGTRGSDTFEGIMQRWRYIIKAFAEVGICIVGCSSDGYAPFLKGMKCICFLPSPHPNCPQEYRAFFWCNYDCDFLCIQDATHIAVKMFRAFMTKDLVLGTELAPRSALIALVRQLGKGATRISLYELEGHTDMMSFSICERASAPGLLEHFKRPEELATKHYLTMIYLIIRAFIDPSTEPGQRLTDAWEVAFFLRFWKFFLSVHARVRRSSDPDENGATHHFTIASNFVSSNVNECVEMCAHNLIMFHDRCYELGSPELFLVTRTGSQPNEAMFRSLRAMSTFGSCMVNFDMRGVMQKAKRLRFLGQHKTDSAINKTFDYTPPYEKPLHVPERLLSREEVREAVELGFENAKARWAELGCFWALPTYPEPNLASAEAFEEDNFCTENSRDFEPTLKTKAKAKTAKNKSRRKQDKRQLKKVVPVVQPGAFFEESSGIIDVADLPDELLEDQIFHDNLDYILEKKQGEEKSNLEIVDLESITTADGSAVKIPKGYIAVSRGGEPFLLKKIAVVWLLAAEGRKISPDRLRRFIGEKRTKEGGRICCGDFVVMGETKSGEDKETVCQALGFRFLKGRKRFFGNSCPLEVTSASGVGVAVLASRYVVAGDIIHKDSSKPSYINISCYKRHIPTRRDIRSGALQILPKRDRIVKDVDEVAELREEFE